ncbi:Uncharacterised protein [Klebsiella aerogenes]|nr:Uncharacterised protein [Klebsiella aerogenes]
MFGRILLTHNDSRDENDDNYLLPVARFKAIRAVSRKRIKRQKPHTKCAGGDGRRQQIGVIPGENIGLQRRGVLQQGGGLNVKQGAVADLALIHLAILLQPLDDQRVQGGDLVRQLAGVKFFPPGLEGAEDRRPQQTADVLAHAE